MQQLLPEFLADITELETKKAELDARLKNASDGDDDEGDESEEADPQFSEEEQAALKRELAMTRKALKAKQESFTQRLKVSRAALQEPTARKLALGILRADLDAILARYMSNHRQQIVAEFETWWDKYRVTLTSIEAERDVAVEKLRGILKGLGYA